MRGENLTEACSVDRIIHKEKLMQKHRKHTDKNINKKTQQMLQMWKSTYHLKTQCLTKGVTCHACGKKEHYRQVCTSAGVNELKDDGSISWVANHGWLILKRLAENKF